MNGETIDIGIGIDMFCLFKKYLLFTENFMFLENRIFVLNPCPWRSDFTILQNSYFYCSLLFGVPTHLVIIGLSVFFTVTFFFEKH